MSEASLELTDNLYRNLACKVGCSRRPVIYRLLRSIHMAAPLTHQQFIHKAIAVHGDRYGYENAVYVNAQTPIQVTCKKHGDFPIRPHNLFHGKGCPKCAGRGLTDAEHIERFRKVHGPKYDYSKFGPYKTAKTNYTFICPAHGEFQQTADRHMVSGCKQCAIDKRATDRVAGNRDSIVNDFRRTHGDKYDYSKVDYQNVKQKVTITCPAHGDFEQTPDHHKQGTGCPGCKRDRLSQLKQKTQKDFLRDANAVHGDIYDYSLAQYVNSETKVTIICPEHGPFEQLPGSHTYGQGCPKCQGFGVTTDIFIEQCRQVHDNKYDYSKTVYTGVFDRIIVGCPEHGEFEPTAKHHRDGIECPVCGMEKASRNLKANKAAMFEERARAMHGDKYDYSKVDYKYARENVTIICPQHGEFEQTASGHLLGSGCRLCAAESSLGSYGLTKALRGDFDEGAPIYLYLVTAVDKEDNKTVYKVGVGNANRIVELRSDMRKAGFDILDSDRRLYQSMGEAIVIEQLLHKQLSDDQYRLNENRRFPGYTELFNAPPDYKAIEQHDLLLKFRGGDRWNYNDG